MKQYSTVIESLTDIVLTINQKDIDRALNQTLPLKIRFLITNIKDFKGMYIGNHYCPEIISFLLKEFLSGPTEIDSSCPAATLQCCSIPCSIWLAYERLIMTASWEMDWLLP